jgi:hypothetical protein
MPTEKTDHPFIFDIEGDTPKKQQIYEGPHNPKYSTPRIVRGLTICQEDITSVEDVHHHQDAVADIHEPVSSKILDVDYDSLMCNDILVVQKYLDDGSIKPIARCVIQASELDIADHYRDTTSDERLASFERYEEQNPDKVHWEVLIKEKQHPVVTNRLDDFLATVPSEYRQGEWFIHMRDSSKYVSESESDIYAFFEVMMLKEFASTVEVERYNPSKVKSLIAIYKSKLIDKFGMDSCHADSWFRTFFSSNIKD